jgi:hypothetical protein
MSGIVAHTCNPSIWEAELGESNVQDQPDTAKEGERKRLRKQKIILEEL